MRGASAERAHLLIHLGMTGQFAVRAAAESVPPHTHVTFSLDDGRELRYTDIRRFGRMLIVPDSQVGAFRDRLGADPLEISEAEFARRIGERGARVKALLLDQRILRGMGNIYVDESLWRARIHPARRGDLSDARTTARAAARDSRRAADRDSAARLFHFGLCGRRGNSRPLPIAPSRVSTGREALLSLRGEDSPHHRGGAQQSFLPEVPAPAAGATRSEARTWENSREEPKTINCEGKFRARRNS